MVSHPLRRVGAVLLGLVPLALAAGLATAPSATATAPSAVPTPTQTVRPLPPLPTPTPSTRPPFVACTASYSVVSQWPGGFVASVRVTNDNRYYALRTWTVQIELPDGQVSTAWSSTVTGTSPATFTAAGWNGRVGLGEWVEFGFQGTGSPTPATITCSD